MEKSIEKNIESTKFHINKKDRIRIEMIKNKLKHNKTAIYDIRR